MTDGTTRAKEGTLAAHNKQNSRLQSFYKASRFHDLTILCGGREWKAHRVIVFSHSPALEKICDPSNIIELPFDYPDAIGGIIESMYSPEQAQNNSEQNEDKQPQLGELMFIARKYLAAVSYSVESARCNTVERARQILQQDSNSSLRSQDDMRQITDAARVLWSAAPSSDSALRKVFLDYFKRPSNNRLLQSDDFRDLVVACGEFAGDVHSACGVRSDVVGRELCISCRKLYMGHSKPICCGGVTFKIKELVEG